MSSPTFYIPPDQIKGDSATLTGDELRHARLTLRLSAGDTVRVVDGEGTAWEAVVRSMGKEESTLDLARKTAEPAPNFQLTIAMGIVQGERFDWAIQKGTELGATAFLPLVTERTEAKINHALKRVPRLERVVISACKQCGRARFPAVYDPIPLSDIDISSYDLAMAFWEEEEVTPLKKAAEGLEPPGTCLMIIGPVGGLTVEEVEHLKGKGCIVVGMGSRILRTETAVTAGAALLQFLWGDLE